MYMIVSIYPKIKAMALAQHDEEVNKFMYAIV